MSLWAEPGVAFCIERDAAGLWQAIAWFEDCGQASRGGMSTKAVAFAWVAECYQRWRSAT